MKKEDRELVLKDLCMRLPYKVKVYGNYKYNNGDRIVDDKKIEVLDLSILDWFVNGIDIKPYLRPVSSMTEEEKEDLLNYVVGKDGAINFEVCKDGYIRGIGMAWVNFQPNTTSRYIGWLLKNHFDICDLIPKGLALEASKDMYNEIKEEKK